MNKIANVLNENFKYYSSKTAVVDEKNRKSYTYLDIARLVTNVSNSLVALGLTNNDKIAILSGDSIGYVVTVLAAIELNIPYIPIDSSYPRKRIEYIIKNSKVRFLVNDSSIDSIDNCLLFKDLVVTRNPSDMPLMVNNYNKCAYIIFTSGTTGNPKGVQIGYKSLMNYLSWGSEYYFCNKKANFPLFTSISFDLSITATFLPFMTGGTLYLYGFDDTYTRLYEVTRNSAITAIKLTPSHLKIFCTMDLSALGNLKSIIVGGEEVNPSTINEFISKIDSNCVSVYNEYGPTEATVGCIVHKHSRSDKSTEPIGYPIANTNIHILRDNVVIKKGIGELVLSGDCLALGYYDNEDLTKDKFGFINSLNCQAYRTGDLVSFLKNGELAYYGRQDKQVKINGNRIELSEVENKISDIHNVVDNVVLKLNTKNNGEQLVCFYVSSTFVPQKNIVKELNSSLPLYMVPSTFFNIKRIPLTPNGKVDRNQLIRLLDKKSTNLYEQKLNSSEIFLKSLFEKELGKNNISIDANFFDLGGESLTALILINKINQRSNSKIDMRIFLRNPTIRKLEQCIELASFEKKSRKKLKNSRISNMLSPTEKGVVFASLTSDNLLTFNEPSLWELDRPLDVLRLQNALQRMVDYFEILRTNYHITDWQLVREVQKREEIDFQFIDITSIPVSGVNQAKMEIKPFDIQDDRLLRVRYIKDDKNKDYLFVDFHHAITDGRSEVVFFHMLKRLYERRDTIYPVQHYSDYVEQLNKKDFHLAHHFWTDLLSNRSNTIAFPYPRGEIRRTSTGRDFYFSINNSISDGVKEYAKSHNVTPYMVLVAAYSLTIQILRGLTSLTILSPFSGRTSEESMNMLGLFSNTLAIPTNIKPSDTLGLFVKRVSSVVMNAYLYQDYPFNNLVDDLKIDHKLTQNILSDVCFVLQNNESLGDFMLGNTHFKKNRLSTNTSKVNLTAMVELKQGCYEVDFQFNPNNVSQNFIKKLKAKYNEVLNCIVSDDTKQVQQV